MTLTQFMVFILFLVAVALTLLWRATRKEKPTLPSPIEHIDSKDSDGVTVPIKRQLVGYVEWQRVKFPNFKYWCPHCDSELSEGPRGGLSMNAVCKKCRINFGCLPHHNGENSI